MLKDVRLEPGFDIRSLAQHTNGFTGSDLKELCRNAAMAPVRDYVRETGDDPSLLEKGQLQVPSSWSYWYPVFTLLTTISQGFKLRPLSMHDFLGDDSDVDSVELPFVDAVEGS
jgi:SpoVK/Ycf46/Vps4 family AAA+-type ATPase